MSARISARTIASVATCAILAGCATTPHVHQYEYVELTRLVEKVECELGDGIKNAVARYPFIELAVKDQKAVASFTLKVVRKKNADGSATFAIPVSGDSLALGFSAGAEQKATRTMNFKLAFNTSALRGCTEMPGQRYESPRIAGSLGLAEWLVEAAEILVETGKAPTFINYGVTFELGMNGRVNPVLRVVNSLSNTHVISGALRGQRDVTNQITVTVKEFDTTKLDPANRPARVIVDDDTKGEAERFELRQSIERLADDD